MGVFPGWHPRDRPKVPLPGLPILPDANGESPSLHSKEAAYPDWDPSRHSSSLRLVGVCPTKSARAARTPKDRASTPSAGFGPRPSSSTSVVVALRRPRCRRVRVGDEAADSLCPRAGAARAGDRFGCASTLAFANTRAVAIPNRKRHRTSAGGSDNRRGDRQSNPESHPPAECSPAGADGATHAAAAPAHLDRQPANGHSERDAGGRRSAVERHGERLILLGQGRHRDRELPIQLG